MTGYSVGFTLQKKDWLQVEPALSELFEAIVIKPERDGDRESPEIISLIFEDDPGQEFLQEQLDFVFESVDLRAPKITVEALPDKDWLQHVYDGLKPIDAGRFYVHGSHVKQSVPTDKIAILIEAAQAFGTGEHPTTKGCLLLFDRLLDHEKSRSSSESNSANNKQPQKILDMGCGSGILAIAAAKTLSEIKKIIGVDIDEKSVHVAANHARDNDVDHDIVFIAGDGFNVPLVQDEKPFDLVFANILAQPLIDMAGALANVATRHVILSGFTKRQVSYVQTPYEKLGFVVHDTIEIDEWVALWLTKK